MIRSRLGLPINVRLVLRASDGGSTDAVVFALWLVPDVAGQRYR
ncbi:MAG: hypothetical protein Q8R56_13055 [Polaromonas sp.]|jgi:hypothetical protein|nr:hypothetical protein [Polaromonas sp.]